MVSEAQLGETLLTRIETRQAVIGIVGLGYVGLPLARAFADRRFRVLGFDIDEPKVARLQSGRSHISYIPDAAIEQMRSAGFEATDRFDRLREPDAIIICVPTPLTAAREPDLSFVLQSAQAVAQRLRRGQLIVLESTTYPGTTRAEVMPLLEQTGLRLGSDYYLAYSPEREDPGNTQHHTANISKLVGGMEPRSLELATTLYAQVTDRVVPVSSPEVAEAAKILENTYRAVNIALVNELKVIYDRMGIDVWEVIEAAKTKPFGFQAFYPGPGLGGHCIPIDPFYLTWVARKHGVSTRFIELAGEINTAMPAYVVARLTDALNARKKPLNGSRIALLGMAYKKDVDDCRESPGLELMEMLLHKGALATYNDPFIPRLPKTRRHPDLRPESQPLTPDYLQRQDAVLIVTDHSAYDWEWVVSQSTIVVDTRNATRNVTRHRDRIVRA
jgi:UDP-N-acetyl-D-glucosamine dehydrogenase